MLGKRTAYQVDSNKICFIYEKGKAFIEVLCTDIINVFVPFESEEHFSKAIEGDLFYPRCKDSTSTYMKT